VATGSLPPPLYHYISCISYHERYWSLLGGLGHLSFELHCSAGMTCDLTLPLSILAAYLSCSPPQ
jgi:hypothetical protein